MDYHSVERHTHGLRDVHLSGLNAFSGPEQPQQLIRSPHDESVLTASQRFHLVDYQSAVWAFPEPLQAVGKPLCKLLKWKCMRGVCEDNSVAVFGAVFQST